MAYVNTARSNAPQTAYRIVSNVYAALGLLQNWNDARVTRNALSRLSAHELQDIGLTRADIDSVIAGRSIR
jgi:uncharacterized protein YjiS (DUF1127 family)